MKKSHYKLAKILTEDTNNIKELKSNTLDFYLLLFKTDKRAFYDYERDWLQAHGEIK